ncbi:MAG TPA: hypothetical protein VN039_10475 [Nitrospira sp.]|nr:hypothetical protein [Nitrospira sp.]
MNLYEQFETNSQCETDGIFIDYGPNSKGKNIRFKLARAGGKNIQFAKAMEKYSKPHRRMIELGLLAPSVAEGIMRTVFIESVLKGWENVEDRAGAELPYSPEAADALFTELPDLFTNLNELARDASNFREELLKADVKN